MYLFLLKIIRYNAFLFFSIEFESCGLHAIDLLFQNFHALFFYLEIFSSSMHLFVNSVSTKKHLYLQLL